MINKNAIGRIIKTARIKNDLTQEELAEAVEISSNYLSKVERGLKWKILVYYNQDTNNQLFLKLEIYYQIVIKKLISLSLKL